MSGTLRDSGGATGSDARDRSGTGDPSRASTPVARPSANWPTTLIAAAGLAISVSILFWLRERTVRALEIGVENATASFEPPEAILGDPDEPRADFSAAEALVAVARRNPDIREVFVTKTHVGDDGVAREVPVVPFDLLAREGPGWTARLEGLRAAPLVSGGRVHGHLYFDLDRSAMRGVDGAIAAASLALVVSLAALVGRLYAQGTTIRRVGGELEERRRELIRLERLALAGRLSANLLHDLKKPVLNVRHQLQDLAADEERPSRERGHESFEEALGQIDLFFQMLNDAGIEKFVRSDRVGEEFVDLNDVTRRAERLVRYERGRVEVVEDFAEDLPPVLAQPFRLVQLISNLVLNAFQAMGGEGRLVLRTRRGEPDAAGRPTAVLEAEDDGPGIPEALREEIFRPFFTTKEESGGTGLGLAICRLIAEEAGGTLGVESREGGPTVFRLRLPAE